MRCQNKLGVVRPATELYDEEAVQALKSGKRYCSAHRYTLWISLRCLVCHFIAKCSIQIMAVNGPRFSCLSSLEAVNRIYEIKGRKHTSPLAICFGDVSEIKHFAVIDHLPHGFLDSTPRACYSCIKESNFWDFLGELSALEKSLNPGMDSVGVREPDYNFSRTIAQGLVRAVALTIANLSGLLRGVCVKDFENLWEHCAYVYDGGVLPSGPAGSTVVDLSRPVKYKILRPESANEETVTILEKHSPVEEATSI
ncbi:hypothetical protein P3X46_000218 [Hevea brasiliensis]|uniref:Threonylcarbamoyl-AMP synthase n=1 Tax=Hevea brasiliensis TaxID=3981 RepID=A0ABQ9N9A9_HEVBR|nr:hypothetical protein P3X46_000218 [Hevea brasiliensis]